MIMDMRTPDECGHGGLVPPARRSPAVSDSPHSINPSQTRAVLDPRSHSPLDPCTRFSGKPFPALPVGGARRAAAADLSDDIIHHHDHRASALCSRDSFLIHNLHALIRELNSPHLTHRQDNANLHLFIPGRPVWVETRERMGPTREYTAPGTPSWPYRWRRLSLAPGVLPRDRERPPRAQGHGGGHARFCMRKLACGAEARHEASR